MKFKSNTCSLAYKRDVSNKKYVSEVTLSRPSHCSFESETENLTICFETQLALVVRFQLTFVTNKLYEIQSFIFRTQRMDVCVGLCMQHDLTPFEISLFTLLLLLISLLFLVTQ